MLLIPGEALVMLSRDPGGPAPQPSGAPAIAAWVASCLGTRTAFVGGVGDDAPGRLMRSTLAAATTDLAGLVTKPGAATATAHVRYFPDGSRAFEFSVAGSAATQVTVRDLGCLPERATWVHVSGSAVMFGGSLADAVIAAVERGRAAGATISVDPNVRAELDDSARRETVRALCRQADVLFPSEGELGALDLDEDRLVARGAVVCRTMAGNGALVRVGGADVAVPAVAAPDEVIDPDGAGDTFAAAVIAARMSGLGFVDAARVASRVVARAIGVPGPMSVRLSPADLRLPVPPERG